MAGEWGRRKFLMVSGATSFATVIAGCTNGSSPSEGSGSEQQAPVSKTPPAVEWETINQGQNKYRIDVRVTFNDAEWITFVDERGVLAQLRSESDKEWHTITNYGGRLVPGGTTVVATIEENPELATLSLEMQSASVQSPTSMENPPNEAATTAPDPTATAAPSPDIDTPTQTPTATRTPTVVDYHTPTPQPTEEFEYLIGLETDFYLD